MLYTIKKSVKNLRVSQRLLQAALISDKGAYLICLIIFDHYTRYAMNLDELLKSILGLFAQTNLKY